MSVFRKKNHLFFFSLFLCFSSLAAAQDIKSSKPVTYGKRWQVGVFLGPDFYYGDLNKYDAGISSSVSMAGGFYVNRQITDIRI